MPLTLALLIGLKIGCYWETNDWVGKKKQHKTLIIASQQSCFQKLSVTERWGDCDLLDVGSGSECVWCVLAQSQIDGKQHGHTIPWYLNMRVCLYCMQVHVDVHACTVRLWNRQIHHMSAGFWCVYHQEHTLTQNKCGTPKSWQYLIHTDSLAKLHVKALITSSLNIDFKDGWSKYLHTCSD